MFLQQRKAGELNRGDCECGDKKLKKLMKLKLQTANNTFVTKGKLLIDVK